MRISLISFIVFTILLSSMVFATGETLDRVVSSTAVAPSGTFTIKYVVPNPSGAYFFSIRETLTGGCTVSTGGTEIVKTLSSPDIETTTVTINAPASGTCTITGDYMLGSNPLVNFPVATITIGGTCTPSCACAANTCTGSTCSNGCGGTCPGTKTCGTGCLYTDWSDVANACGTRSVISGTGCTDTTKACPSKTCEMYESLGDDGKCQIASWVWLVGGVFGLLIVLQLIRK